MLVEEQVNRKSIALLPHQHEAWFAEEDLVALITGLGGGKTWTGARWLICRAIEFPESIHLATVNSYPQARDLVIPAITTALEELGIEFKFVSRDLNFFLYVNGRIAKIRVRSTERHHVDKLRGPEYGSIWMDEARDCSHYAYKTVRMRLRCKKVDRPRMLITTTPRGHNWLHYEFVLNVRASSRANTYLLKSYVEETLGEFDEVTVLQEREGEFVATGRGQVYRSFDHAFHVVPCAYDPRKPLALCADFNVGLYGWVLAQEHLESPGPGRSPRVVVRVIAEHTPRNTTVELAAKSLAAKWGKHAAGWDLYPDAAGNTQRNRQTGRTDTEALLLALRQCGVSEIINRGPKANPLVSDRVSSVNALFRNALGEVRLLIDPGCRELIRDCQSLEWKENGLDIDKDKDADRSHCSDALGYFVWAKHRPSGFVREVLQPEEAEEVFA